MIPDQYAQLVQDAAAANALRPELLGALLEHESAWNPSAVGDNGVARGLGQMHPAACETVGASWDDMFDPAKAIPAVAKYLAFCIKHCGGDERLGVMAFNQGPTVISRAMAYRDAVYALIPA